MANDNKGDQKTYRQMAGDYYNKQYQSWMPWAEDQYLRWFTKDNKASYSTKQNLDKTKLTSSGPLSSAQDSVNEQVSGQLGQGGLAQPLGDAVSKEGVNRAERGGKDDTGSGPLGGYGDAAMGGMKGAGESVAGGVKGVWGGGEDSGRK